MQVGLQQDFLEQRGFTYNESTFDDLFVHGWDQDDDGESESSDEEQEKSKGSKILGGSSKENTFGDEMTSVMGAGQGQD
jgi:hypothetical protein